MLSHRSHLGLFKISKILGTLFPLGSHLSSFIFPLRLIPAPLLFYSWPLQAACSSPGPFSGAFGFISGPQMLCCLQNYERAEANHLQMGQSIFRWAVSSQSEQSHPDVPQCCQQTCWQTQTWTSTNRCTRWQKKPCVHVMHTPRATQVKENAQTHTYTLRWHFSLYEHNSFYGVLKFFSLSFYFALWNGQKCRRNYWSTFANGLKKILKHQHHNQPVKQYTHLSQLGRKKKNKKTKCFIFGAFFFFLSFLAKETLSTPFLPYE